MKQRTLPICLAAIMVAALLLSACTAAPVSSAPSSSAPVSSVPLAVSSVAPSDAEDVELSTPSGPIKGLQQDGYSVYKGIPYANTPERFAPSEVVTPWTQTRDCTEFGPIAIQARASDGMEMSEDCLSLNVWTPAKEEGEKLPVYVWIHGGGFAQGSGAEASYDGAAFAKQGIVYISINYRLNALGFLATQETFDQYGTTGCWGLLDQITALKWVQENVAAFGGDPAQVTVGGESAGSYSTSMLVQSPLAEGLFSRAIMESGSMLGVPGNNQFSRGNRERSMQQGAMMSYTFGANDDAAGLDALRAADPEVFAQMSPLYLDFTILPAFMMTPVFDGYVLPENAHESLSAGNVNDVDLLWGFNGDEGSLFIPEEKTEAQYEMLASKMFGYENAAAVMERFPVDSENDATERCRQILAYGMFSAVMKPYADALAGNGRNVYAYYFNYTNPDDAENGLGANHGSEIEYAFGNLSADASDEQQALSAEMHTRWVNFIKTGDPNSGDVPTDLEWPRYDTESRDAITFDSELTSGELPGLADIEFMEDIMFGENGYYFS